MYYSPSNLQGFLSKQYNSHENLVGFKLTPIIRYLTNRPDVCVCNREWIEYAYSDYTKHPPLSAVKQEISDKWQQMATIYWLELDIQV